MTYLLSKMSQKSDINGLPNEMIVEIFKRCEAPERTILSQVSKRFLNIYKKDAGLRFMFHLQGHTNNLFNHGLYRLLHTNFVSFKELKISKFDLKQSFDLEYNSENLFNLPYDHYITSSQSCREVDTITIEECILTLETLSRLRRLFPHLVNLTLSRNFIIESNPSPLQSHISFSPIVHVSLTTPIYTDIPSFIGWLINYCISIEELKLSVSMVSEKRAVARKYYHYKNGTEALSNPMALPHVLEILSDIKEVKKLTIVTD